MARSKRLHALGLLVALGALVRCVPSVDQDGRPCPCAAPYTCCEATQICIATDGFCPDAAGQSGDASSMDGSGKGGSGGQGGSRPSGGVAGVGGTSGGSGGSKIAGGETGVGGDASAAGESTASAGAGGEGGSGGAPCDITPESCGSYARQSNVLVLIYNPVLKSGMNVREYLSAPDARALSAELAERLRGASGGLLNYRLVEAREVPEWPPQRPGTMPLDETSFLGGVYDKNYVSFTDGNVADGALNADYGAIFAEQDLCSVVKAKDISEIWLWGAHNNEINFGFEYFSYRLASDALPASATDADRALYRQRRRNIPDCGRTLFLLGAQYSEGMSATGNAHRSYNFRVTELLELALRTQSQDSSLGASTWQEFSQYLLGPGDSAQVGTPVFPPNAGVGVGAGTEAVAWDYANTSDVLSGADRWLNYPDLSAKPHDVNCSVWGCTNEGFQNWYSRHIPRSAGAAPSGSCANWWQYIADPDVRLAPCCGADCHPAAPLGLPCAGDGDCASGHCACQGASVCVSEAVGTCGSPNWALCDDDASCASDVCGCNDGPKPKVCLPNGGYPRDCSN